MIRLAVIVLLALVAGCGKSSDVKDAGKAPAVAGDSLSVDTTVSPDTTLEVR
jgi:hypothetical protein